MDTTQLNVQAGAPVQAQKKGISGSTIKIIAVAAMLIDHVGAVVLVRMLMANGFGEAIGSGEIVAVTDWMMNNAALYLIYTVMRMIGRLGFPIFCFLLVEGFQKTRDVRKYALRMGLFALISEIPFNLAITGNFFDLGFQNVYFTLFLGLFALCAYEFLAKYRKSAPSGWYWMIPVVLGVLFTALYGTSCVRNTFYMSGSRELLIVFVVLCVAAAAVLAWYGRNRSLERIQIVGADMTVLMLVMFLADFLRTDYSGMGVLTITAMYIFRKNKVLSMTAGCVVLTIMSFSEVTAFFAIIAVALYNGKRGLKMKYFFYAFYPAHLLLLYLISVLMGLGNVTLLY